MNRLDTFDEVLDLSLKSEQPGFSHMAALTYVALIVSVRVGGRALARRPPVRKCYGFTRSNRRQNTRN